MSEPAYGSRPDPESPPPSSLLHEPPGSGYGPAGSGYGPAGPGYGPAGPGYGPAGPGYGPVGPGYAPLAAHPPAYGMRAVTTTDRNWAVAAHLSGFVAAYIALGFLGPLIVMITEGSRRPFVRRHAVEALNFNLSILLWFAISAVLVLVLIGLVMLVAVGILYLVATILGAMAASRGEDFRYPMTIRFVS
jgi:uncharacterized protein